jgi:hypothetical protein
MNQCLWIGSGEHCTEPEVPGRSYCEHHIWQVYQKGTALGKRKKDLRVVDRVRALEQLMDEAIQELEAEGYL